MSKIKKLPDQYDLWLSYTWSSNNHGICGHIYEVFDYYHILKNYFKVGMFFAEDINWNEIEFCIRQKYDFTEEEILQMKSDSVFFNRPKILFGKNILFTDGGVINNRNVVLKFDNIFYFACGNLEIKDNEKKNVWILQDDRVYSKVKLNGINYKKRILFDRLKKINKTNNKCLVYATKNCRKFDSYDELLKYGKLLVITNEENKKENTENIEFVVAPVKDLFEQFETYIYTPVNRKWDCSPRLIAECQFYNKKVVYHNIDYWNEDLGLYWRNWDIENDFSSLFLKHDDEIVKILKNIIK